MFFALWRGILNLALILSLIPGLALRAPAAQPKRSGLIVVLVNASSPGYAGFTQKIQPYLDHFGVPYTVVDLSADPLPADLGSYAEILVGHTRLDPENRFLDRQAQARIAEAVRGGTGLVNFDHVLTSSKNQPLYPYLEQVFGFSYGGKKAGAGIGFKDPQAHYITAKHAKGEWIATGAMTLAGIQAEGAGVLAATGGQAFLVAREYGAGRAVQWGSMDWMASSVRGPLHGLDDLVWRSIVWAARKPFVLQALPPFLTMRVDDVSGPLWWAHTASERFGIQPWLGVFINDFSDAETRDLSRLVNDGKATALVHAFNMAHFLFYDKHTRAWADAQVERFFKTAQQWHTDNHIPMSTFAVGHYYEMGANSFAGLERWGVTSVGTLVEPGKPYGSAWVNAGPFRRFERGSSLSTEPFYYADYVSVPGHPEYDKRFFNCMTEIRDDAGYEWFPGPDVKGSVERGVHQSRRALDSLALATLFTHEYHILNAGPEKWQAILQGVTQNLAEEHPILTTLDHACDYARAIHDTAVTGADYDSSGHALTITMQGRDSIPTQLYLFTEAGEKIKQVFIDVPVIDGSSRVVYKIQ